MKVQQTHSSNGMTIISGARSNSFSCAVGLWLQHGALFDPQRENGSAHLLEHVIFHSVDNRSRVTRMGGEINAQTGHELMTLFGWVPANDVVELLELFIEKLMVREFSEKSIRSEAAAIEREVMEHNSLFARLDRETLGALWPGYRGIDGVVENTNNHWPPSAREFADYRDGMLYGKRLAVVAAGQIDHAALVEAVQPLARLPAGAQVQPTPFESFTVSQPSVCEQGDQSYVRWTLIAPQALSSAYPALLIAHHVISESPHSRLNNVLRHSHGHVYAVLSDLEFLSNVTIWNFGFQCDTQHRETCIASVNQVMNEAIEVGFEQEQLDDAKAHLVARLKISMDDNLGTMLRLGREHFLLKRNPTVEEYCAQLGAVDNSHIRELLASIWDAVDRGA